MSDIILSRAAQAVCHEASWGDLTWWGSGAQGNCTSLTVGRCRLLPGQGNPRHRHPHCVEFLVVLCGRIAHTVARNEEAELGPGDSVHIACGVMHQARNIGQEPAELLIVFDSADRQVEGE